MESAMDRCHDVISEAEKALCELIEIMPEFNKLKEYYKNGWLNDFRLDEGGQLPKDLKRGVLSEDGLYDVLTEYENLREYVKKAYEICFPNEHV